MPDYQTLANQRGEVTYRRRAAFGEPEKVYDLAAARAGRRSIFADLQGRGVALSPFLELGAERGQTSLLLANEFAAEGYAADLSVESLQVIPPLQEHFRYAVQPLAIACDATRMPVRDNALPFIFTFATLHHFLDMAPVLAEVRRMLGDGGRFFFGEEPLKRLLCLNLYRCPRPDQLRGAQKWLLDHNLLQYIAEAYVGSREEVEYGIVENESISVEQWEQALGVFDDFEIDYRWTWSPEAPAVRRLAQRLGLSAPRAERLAARLFGCVLSGLCRVRKPQAAVAAPLAALLVCPDCRHPLALETELEQYSCPAHGLFERRGNVHLLLPRIMKDQLYPPSAS